MLLSKLNEFAVVDTAGADKDHAVRGVVRLYVGGKIIAADGEDVRLRTEDGASEGLTYRVKRGRAMTSLSNTRHTLEGHGVQVVEDNLLHLLVHLLLLTQDDIALPLNRRVLEFGVLQDVADDVHGLADVLAEALCVVDGLLTGSVRVEVSTEVFNLELKGVLTAFVGTLESHMFQEVGRSARLVGLRTRAGINPYTDSSRLGVRMRLGCDCQAIREGSELGSWTVHHRGERPQWPSRPLYEGQSRRFRCTECHGRTNGRAARSVRAKDVESVRETIEVVVQNVVDDLNVRPGLSRLSGNYRDIRLRSARKAHHDRDAYPTTAGSRETGDPTVIT